MVFKTNETAAVWTAQLFYGNNEYPWNCLYSITNGNVSLALCNAKQDEAFADMTNTYGDKAKYEHTSGGNFTRRFPLLSKIMTSYHMLVVTRRHPQEDWWYQYTTRHYWFKHVLQGFWTVWTSNQTVLIGTYLVKKAMEKTSRVPRSFTWVTHIAHYIIRKLIWRANTYSAMPPAEPDIWLTTSTYPRPTENRPTWAYLGSTRLKSSVIVIL